MRWLALGLPLAIGAVEWPRISYHTATLGEVIRPSPVPEGTDAVSHYLDFYVTRLSNDTRMLLASVAIAIGVALVAEGLLLFDLVKRLWLRKRGQFDELCRVERKAGLLNTFAVTAGLICLATWAGLFA